VDLYLLSGRALISAPSWNIVYEFEDLLLRIHGGHLLVPNVHQVVRWVYYQVPIALPWVDQVLRRSIGRYRRLGVSPSRADSTLLVLGLNGNHHAWIRVVDCIE